MNPDTASNRIISFDVLRIIAAFAVVLSHLTWGKFNDYFPSYEWEIISIYNSIGRWCVPIFVMISGALFLNPEKRIDIKKLYTRNIFRIIYIFLFWSLCYALYEARADHVLTVPHIVRLTIKGPFHFWFLKMLLALYIAVPILRVVTQNKRLEEYFILVAIISTIVIPMIIGFFSEDDHKFFYVFRINRSASAFAGYFVIGHYLFTYQLSNILKRLIYLMGILSVLSVICLTHWYSHLIGESSELFFDSPNVFILFESMAVFLLVIGRKVPKESRSMIVKLSSLSLGVYIVHVFVFNLVFHLFWVFGINVNSLSPILFIPCFSLFIFVISCLIVALLKKIPILKKLVM